jgi:hypothetical protein
MRKPNHADAELLIRLYELRREPEFRKARAWFLTEFKVQSWDEIKVGYLQHSERDRWFRQVVTYWEMVATLVNRGVLHPDLLFDSTGEDVVTWERCKPWIEGARASIRPTYLYHFETMVKDHLAFRARGIAAWNAATSGGSANGRARARKPRARARAR